VSEAQEEPRAAPAAEAFRALVAKHEPRARDAVAAGITAIFTHTPPSALDRPSWTPLLWIARALGDDILIGKLKKVVLGTKRWAQEDVDEALAETPDINDKVRDALGMLDLDAPPLDVIAFTAEELLGPIEPVRYLIEGLVPCDAYTLVAGALSAGKTTFALSLAIWRATGEDVLGLNFGELLRRAEAGPVSYITYEDPASIIRRRLMIVVQAMHRQLDHEHGRVRAAEFIANLVKHLRIVHLTGQPGAQLVVRSQYGQPEVNRAQIEALVATLKAHAAAEHLIVLDPLRLAFSGSQNDDNGADLVVMVLNDLSTRLRDSALLLLSHVTKAMAADQGNNRVALAYGTSGSGVYSQHARSNMHMGRLEPQAIERLRQRLSEDCRLTDEEVQRRSVTTLTHARLSHEAEGADAHFVMRQGLLIPLRLAEGRAPESVMTRLRREWPEVAEAIQRIHSEGGRASPETLQGNATLRRDRTREDVRDLIRSMASQGWIDVQGNTRNRVLVITDLGRQLLGGNAAGIDGAA